MLPEIFDIQKFSLHDGPGIRTTVFFKGCLLHCVWCHNPESWAPEPELMLDLKKCSLCGLCSKECAGNCHIVEHNIHRINRDKCRKCGKCVEVCLNNALQIAGRQYQLDELMDILLADELFYRRSGGGVTLSGGEPLLHKDFVTDLLTLLRQKNIHTAVETSGMVPTENVKSVLDKVDLWLFDCKVQPRLMPQFTGGSWQQIQSNLRLIDSGSTPLILRCPLIPGINDNDEHRDFIVQLAGSLKNLQALDIEPYNPLGIGKYDMLDRPVEYSQNFADSEAVEHFIEDLQKSVRQPVRKL